MKRTRSKPRLLLGRLNFRGKLRLPAFFKNCNLSPSVLHKHSLSLTHTHTHTHTLSFSFSLNVSFSLSYTHTLSHSLFLSFSTLLFFLLSSEKTNHPSNVWVNIETGERGGGLLLRYNTGGPDTPTQITQNCPLLHIMCVCVCVFVSCIFIENFMLSFLNGEMEGSNFIKR